MKIKFDMQLMGIMDIFSKITRSNLKDCINDEIIYFVVEPGEIGKAIGKSGKNVKILEKKLNKKIKIVEFNKDVKQFIKNFIFPLKIKEITGDNEIIMIVTGDLKTRGFIIGRNANSLRYMESIVKRYFKITEIKVQ